MNPNIIGSIILEGANTIEDTVIVDGGSSKRVLAQATLQDMDVENRNHRIYAKKDLSPEINGPRMKELIDAGYLLSEFGHPLSSDIVRQQTIDPKLACARISKVWIEGNLIKGQYSGTFNEYGEMIDQDLRAGYKPAFSLRALGAIENVGGKAYVRGIKVITWDVVCYPSHRVAYTEKLITENALSCGNNPSDYKQDDMFKYNETGRIIHLTGSDAQDILNRLQRESANIGTILETFDGIADKVTLSPNKDRIILTNAFGDRFNIRLENHVDNLIMNYVYGL